jgi:CPA2 family monovalent cation:H+ antiporter-2
MDEWIVIVDLALLLGAALVLGALCERIGQSVIVGYLVAGMLLGPNALALIESSDEVEMLAELGVALLLFAIGLEFSWRRVREMGLVALGGGTLQVVATAALGAGIAAAVGLPGRTALVIGPILALSSTACVLRVLEARGELESLHGFQALGILLVQDIAVIPLVLFATVLAQEGGTPGSIAVTLAESLALAALAALALYVVFMLVVPRILRLGSVYASRELSVLTAIVSGLGAVLLAHKAGLSPGLGAFIAGMLLAESPFAAQVRADVSALRILFVTVFFSSIGALGDPGWMVAHWHLLLPTIALLVIGKSAVTWASLRVFGAGKVSALAAGVCLGQIGEFSFIIIEIARGTLISNDLFLLLVSSTLLTMLLTPYLVAAAPRVAGGLLRSRSRGTASTGTDPHAPEPQQVLVIGFGPAGRAASERIREAGGEVVVLDLNPHGVASARRLGYTAFLGDGQHADILRHAGARRSRAVVVTVPAPPVAITIVRLVRLVAPSAVIVARSRYNRFFKELVDAGAEVAHDEETYVGVRMSESVLEVLETANDEERGEGEAAS